MAVPRVDELLHRAIGRVEVVNHDAVTDKARDGSIYKHHRHLAAARIANFVELFCRNMLRGKDDSVYIIVAKHAELLKLQIPVKIVAADKGRISRLAQRLIQRGDYASEKGDGQRWHHNADGQRPVGFQASRVSVDAITQSLDRFIDSLAVLIADITAVEIFRNSRKR
ncbi:hypothetical protein SDC9_106431 [bioreactor metagenome]|uniref:Uncharacterized protein n=1 Tax=bioreactor metagenome TaxID=1076179 RepID=A0A645B2G8_9ZZZZ